ncbi:MAG: tetratricopeptide repeat protein, partial [Planctomycetota bacterium]
MNRRCSRLGPLAVAGALLAPFFLTGSANAQLDGVTPTREELQEQFTKLIETGQTQLGEGDFAAAVQTFTEAARMTSNNPQTLLLRAQALYGVGELEAALADVKDAISSGQIAPGFTGQARNLRAQIYLQLGAIDDALRDAQAAVKEDRGNPDYQRVLGKAQVLIGDSLSGEKSLSKYLSAAEAAEATDTLDAAEAYRLRGQAFASMGKFPKAIADIDRSLEIDPEEHESYMTKGMIYLQDKDYKPAIDAIEQAIANYEPADPDLPVPYAQAYLTRASALEEYGKQSDEPEVQAKSYRESKLACETLLDELSDGPETAPTRAATLFRLGVAERLLGDLPAAVKAFSEAINLNPSLGEAYFRRGVCFFYLDEPRLALGDFEQGAAINFDSPRSNLWKGRCWVSLGDQREAIKAFSEAVAVSDRYTIAYVHRGLTYLQIGEYQRAVNDFNNAIRLEPTSGEHYYYRGVGYSRLGESERSINSLVLALKFDNKLLGAYDAIEEELRRAGRG